MNSIRILIADDHDIFNLGMKVALEKDPFLKVVGEANSGEHLLKLITKLQCDLVICDYKLPGMNGIETLAKAKKLKSNLKTILISSIEKFEVQALCEKNKIDAYLFKSDVRNKIVEIANQILRNKTYRPIENQGVNPANPLLKLTKKEIESLRFWSSGKSLDETGSHMKVNIKTVETHRANIKKKLPGLSKAEIFSLLKDFD
jgi:DNA-binding NarL/FixJ family response regulator